MDIKDSGQSWVLLFILLVLIWFDKCWIEENSTC